MAAELEESHVDIGAMHQNPESALSRLRALILHGAEFSAAAYAEFVRTCADAEDAPRATLTSNAPVFSDGPAPATAWKWPYRNIAVVLAIIDKVCTRASATFFYVGFSRRAVRQYTCRVWTPAALRVPRIRSVASKQPWVFKTRRWMLRCFWSADIPAGCGCLATRAESNSTSTRLIKRHIERFVMLCFFLRQCYAVSRW